MRLTQDGELHVDNYDITENGLVFIGSAEFTIDSDVFLDPMTTMLLGRSGQTQMGFNAFCHDYADTELIGENRVRVPVNFEFKGGFTELEQLMEIICFGTKVRVGRLINWAGAEKLNYEGTRKAADNKDFLCVGDEGEHWRINEDGSISVKLDPGYYIHHENTLRNPEVLRQVILHGRDGISRVQDFLPEGPPTIGAKELFVGGIRLSTGKFEALIRPGVSDQVDHLNGGLFLDAYRSTRVGNRYGGSGLRQVELFNNTDTSVETRSLWVTLDLYPNTRDKGAVPSHFISMDDKLFMHEHGVSFAQATNLGDANIRELIFEGVEPSSAGGGIHGRVITRNGVSPIDWARTKKFQDLDARDAVENRSGKRAEDDRFAGFVQSLSETKDQGRVLVTHGLPSVGQLRLLVNRGVKAFVFKGVRPAEEVNRTKKHTSRNIYLDPQLHKELCSLEEEGISFNFICEIEEGETAPVREFYKGFWCKPEAKQKLDKIEVVIDMYGWHKGEVSDMCEAEVRVFLKAMIELHGPGKVAIATGIGPGFMDLADRIAKELGIFRFGIGIDVEEKEQTPSVDADAMLHFDSSERAYRQKLLDELGVAKIFNIGGFGTSEETWITCCSTKLGEYLPMPLLFIDGSEGEHLWESNKRQMEVISNTTEFRFKSLGEGEDKVVDIRNPKMRLGNPWVANIIHTENSYVDAMNIWRAFKADPISYWREAGIPSAELFYAYENHQVLLGKLGRALPSFLVEAMAKLKNERPHYDEAVAAKWEAGA